MTMTVKTTSCDFKNSFMKREHCNSTAEEKGGWSDRNLIVRAFFISYITENKLIISMQATVM